MLIGYARVSKADGSQSLDPQCDALIAAGVDARQIYSDRASGMSVTAYMEPFRVRLNGATRCSA